MSTGQIPPGGTYLNTLKRSFTDVPVQANNGNAIPTTEFLEAAESLVSIFDVLGSAAFSPVKSDMLGNVEVRQLSSPALTEVPYIRRVQLANNVLPSVLENPPAFPCRPYRV